jgi:hypothetical protein
MTNEGGTSPPANDEWLVAHEGRRPGGLLANQKQEAGAQPEATAADAKGLKSFWSHVCASGRLRAKARNTKGEPEPPTQSKWCRSPPASEHITERPSTRFDGGGACHQGAMWELGRQEGVSCVHVRVSSGCRGHATNT